MASTKPKRSKQAAKKTGIRPPAAKKAKPKSPAKATAPAKKPNKAEPASVAPSKHKLAALYGRILKEANRSVGLTSGAAVLAEPISTGLLTSDYIQTGGMYPGMYHIAGEAGSGKSTSLLLNLSSAVNSDVPLIVFHDAEGSLTPDYADEVLAAYGIGDIFGSGRASYIQSNVAEDFIAHMHALLRRMPDKVWLVEQKTWAYAVDKGLKTTKAMVASLEAASLKVDRKLSTETRWIFPTDYAGPEAVILLDSWAALNSRMTAEEDEKGAGMAAMARIFSEGLRKFGGRLQPAGVILASANQLRTNPGIRYGSPLYSPGGGALDFYSHVKTQMFSRAVPEGNLRDKEASMLCVEPSVSGGLDHYAYKAINNVKNKRGSPWGKTTARVWVSDHMGKPRGFCPVHDVLTYLEQSGQLSGPRRKLVISPTGKAAKALAPISGRPLDYSALKAMIVAEHFDCQDRELTGKALKGLGIVKPLGIRKVLFHQVRAERASSNLRAVKKAGKQSEEESVGDDD